MEIGGETMKYLKAFVAGIVIPATILQIATLIEFFIGWPPIKQSYFFHQLPIVWAVWNVVYVAYGNRIWPANKVLAYLLHGAVLGVILLIPALFFAIPKILGFTGEAQYIPIGLVPIVYALIWAFGVRPLNRVFGIE